MKKQKTLVKFNWFEIVTGVVSLISIILLLLTVFLYIIGRDYGDVIAILYSIYFINIQVFVTAVIFCVSIYMFVNTKRVKNIKDKDPGKIYIYRLIFLAISIIISLLIAAILSYLVYLHAINLNHASSLNKDVILSGSASLLSVYYIIPAIFFVLAIHIPTFDSCFLADKYYCKKTNINNIAVKK